jgi:iron complex outermembrane recepter protein
MKPSYRSRLNLRPNAFVLAILAIGFAPCTMAQTAPASSTNVGTVTVTGEGDKLGNGLLIEEDSSKAKSTITRAALEKARPSSNPFQLLELTPSVNTYNHDATGLFGGQLKVRGFNSDQLGFTINGAPVNDSGNFAVFPQEYTDTENLCEVFVTQGSADTEAPHVGASGGNVGMVTCEPSDKFRVRLAQSVGQNSFARSFIRLDTGKIGSAKAFISYSKSKADKWKGKGEANRDHLDAGWALDITPDTTFTGSLLYNNAVNNNFLAVTKAEYAAFGDNFDFSTKVPQHQKPGAGAQVESDLLGYGTSPTKGATGTPGPAPAPRTTLPYYGYALNPFKNYLLTTRVATKVNKDLTLSAEPYYWYGYGTGGVQQTTVAETSGGTRLGGGVRDINGDGDTLDTIGVYRGSVTKTNRPGITFKANYAIGNHRVLAGYWVERAKHQQTAPATRVDNNGNIDDLWLSDSSQLLKRADGTLYQNRDWLTISRASTLFVQDTISLLDSKLDVTFGLRAPSIKRDFTNNASEGFGSGANYNTSKKYSDTLPSLGARYKIDDRLQVFGNVTKNMRAPSNFTLSGGVASVTYENGAPTKTTIALNDSVEKETSLNIEGGVRYSGEALNASATLFNMNFKNRLAQSFNPVTQLYSDYNVGDVRIRGIEAEIGTKPSGGFSYYGSATFTSSKILSDFQASKTVSLATSGKKLPDTPSVLLGASAQYASGPYLVKLSAKHVGSSYSTLLNDEDVPAFTTVDLSAAYRFASSTFFKNPTIRLNVSNLFNKRYLRLNAGSGSNIATTADTNKVSSSQPTYYIGAPRFTSLTFSADF